MVLLSFRDPNVTQMAIPLIIRKRKQEEREDEKKNWIHFDGNYVDCVMSGKNIVKA